MAASASLELIGRDLLALPCAGVVLVERGLELGVGHRGFARQRRVVTLARLGIRQHAYASWIIATSPLMS